MWASISRYLEFIFKVNMPTEIWFSPKPIDKLWDCIQYKCVYHTAHWMGTYFMHSLVAYFILPCNICLYTGCPRKKLTKVEYLCNHPIYNHNCFSTWSGLISCSIWPSVVHQKALLRNHRNAPTPTPLQLVSGGGGMIEGGEGRWVWSMVKIVRVRELGGWAW